jgi:hypothetical protein
VTMHDESCKTTGQRQHLGQGQRHAQDCRPVRLEAWHKEKGGSNFTEPFTCALVIAEEGGPRRNLERRRGLTGYGARAARDRTDVARNGL